MIIGLKPKTFNFIGSPDTVAGFIAQEINKTKTEWVIQYNDEEYIIFDDKGYIQAGLVGAIQEFYSPDCLLKCIIFI